MLKTQNYGFNKPELSDSPPDITVMNPNWDTIDKKIKENTDAIAQNSQEIGQKLDKESSFYADIEAYYGNTKLVDDFQDISKWTSSASVVTTDITNYKLGNSSIKVTAPDTLNNSRAMSMSNIVLDLSVLNNGESSGETDFINLALFISDVSKITTLGVYIGFSQEVLWNVTNCKHYTIPKTNLITGWNFVKIKKSQFSTNGTGEWTNIKSTYVRWQSDINAQNAYVSFQLLQLVKADHLEDKPNPFQKFEVTEFTINSGEWFVGKEFGELCIKELTGSKGVLGALVSTKVFKNFIANFTIKSKNIVKRYVGALCNNLQTGTLDYFYIQLLQQGSSSEIQLVKVVGGVLETISKPFYYNANDEIHVVLERKDNKLLAKIKTNNIEEILTTEFNVPTKMSLSLGMDSGGRSHTYSSASITEISNSHHSDVSEVAKRLSVHPYSNPNLLINGNFQVWQRGNTFQDFALAIAKYTADRWYINTNGDNVKVEKTAKGIKVTKLTKVTTTWAFLAQCVETNINIKNKQVTFSIKVADCIKDRTSIILGHGVPTGMGVIATKTISNEGITTLTAKSHSSENICVGVDLKYLNVGESIEIEWMKLELGEIATPLSPRPVGEELTLCKRYYEQFMSPVGAIFTSPIYVTNNNCYTIRWNVEKRVSPSVKIYSSLDNTLSKMNLTKFSGNSLSENLDVGSVLRCNTLECQMIVSSHNFVKGDVIAAKVEIDAEIY